MDVKANGGLNQEPCRGAQGKSLAQRGALSAAIAATPRVALQRKQLNAAFGRAIQGQAGLEEEELLQGKFSTLQRHGAEEEELLQGRFGPVQRQTGPEEEELLQGKFDAVQRQGPEDEELQMKQGVRTATPAQFEPDPAPRKNNTGLPDNLKSGIESLSGMSMDNVKVHYNSAQPAQLNALAYAQGRDIHVAPGQEKHLPHEAWHVAQQAQGRVGPTMQTKDGVPVNDDHGLEREADLMGEKALQMGERFVTKAQGPALEGSGMAPAPGVAQRNVGFEFEVSDYFVVTEDGDVVEGGHDVAAKQNGFELQAELNGCVEFVTDPPGFAIAAEFTKTMNALTHVAKVLETGKKGERIKATNLEGGKPDYYIRAADRLIGFMHATAGVPLSKMKAFYEGLYGAGAKVPVLDTNHKSAKEHGDLSRELQGLLVLIYEYLKQGWVPEEYRKTAKVPFPKGIIPVMARTHFAAMYALTPEGQAAAYTEEEFVKLVLDDTKYDPKGRVFDMGFGDPHEKTVHIETTRRDWLGTMTRGFDKLTTARGGHKKLKTMGALGSKTEAVGEEAAPLVEVRNFSDNVHWAKWFSDAAVFFNHVMQVTGEKEKVEL